MQEELLQERRRKPWRTLDYCSGSVLAEDPELTERLLAVYLYNNALV